MLGVGLGVVLAASWWSTAPDASASGETRSLSLYNVNTKESLSVTFKRDGKYDEAALKRLNTFMRDWRRDEETKMDPELVDLIWTLHRQLGSKRAIHLISGYRSATTNAKLRRTRGGQAKRSQHIQGKAADIHFPDISVKDLRNSALVQEVGGVGYYPTSGIPFVHVDTGNVRMWPRIPRLELAALFPKGHTKYLPKDGKPITSGDYKLAMAKGLTGRTMVASAAPSKPEPEAAAQPVLAAFTSSSESGASPDMPRPILASFAPDPMVQPAVAHEDTDSAPRLFAYASTGGLPALSRPSLRSKEAGPKLYEKTSVVGAPEVDDDHPDELSYVPFETASLMTETSVAYNGDITPLVHPEQENIDYLFDDMDEPTAFMLRKTSGYRGLAASQQFSGQAVKSLYAEVEQAPAPTRIASKH
ncbi:MAG: DUF882 domain-containing protein [Methyloceanibacter sp.]